MGSDNTPQKERYLSKEEIKKEADIFIKDLFQKYKNIDGCLSKNDFRRITNGLIDSRIINKIFKICSSKNDKLSKGDFKYFYALLKTKHFDAKINFLLYFIFGENTVILKETYISLVKKYYENSKLLIDIFLNNNIINNEVIEKVKVLEFIKSNYKKQIENYKLNNEISNLNSIEEEEDNISQKDNININEKNNLSISNDNSIYNISKYTYEINPILSLTKNTCICLTKKSKSIINSTDFYTINASLINKYDSLSLIFEEYKAKNNGIFPLSLLRHMLKEMYIISSLIDLITNYIEKKTKKAICTFELFKEVLTILTMDLEEKENKNIFAEGLFLLFSYPNDYIDKTSFCSFIQLTKNNFSLNSVNEILNKYSIPKKIYIEKFGEIIDYLISELSLPLERIKYLPYIYFDYAITNKIIEKNCILILMNGKDLKKYILEKAIYQNKFYIIDSDFWETWKRNMNLQNYDELKTLKINTEKLCDKNGKMNEGLVYLNNYIILTEQIYHLFCRWYGKPGIEIEREKIFLEKEDDNNNNFQSIDLTDKDTNYFLKGEDYKTNKKFEIEINPVFILFLYFSDLKDICGESFTNLKEEIKKRMEDTNIKFNKYSRKTKFSKLLLIMQEKERMELDENNSRIWIYYHERFEIINNNNDSLEKQGIINKAVLILEINKHGKWPIEELQQKKTEEYKEESPLMGLMNLGNTCYLNSVLQIFLNIKEMKNIFDLILSQGENYLNFLLNCKSEKVILFEEFINLLKGKYLDKKKTLIPKKFKSICGKFNENFAEYVQQDANDFYIFLLQSLHEGINIKTNNIYIENRDILNETISETENELGNEYWANNIRNNASYIYGLFTGQFQSKLICQYCHKEKIKYETFSSLDLPIPEGNNIVIFVKLFRLPLSLSTFKNSEKSQIKFFKENINYEKKKKFDISVNEQINLEIQNNEKLINLQKSNIKNELIMNELNFNIPILLKIMVSRKEKCKMIIEILKSMMELSLDMTEKYTKYIIISKNRYINPELIIDDTITNNGQIEIYELLNFEGIKNIFKYQNLSQYLALPISDNEINFAVNSYQNEVIDDKKTLKEIMIEIKHRVKRDSEENNFLVDIPLYTYLRANRDFVIITNYQSIKIIDLYELIWKKYMYFCDIPAKLENSLWWKRIKTQNKEDCICSPFILKIVKKETFACNYCPWYKLCTGCILNPLYQEYFSIPKNCYLIVEWCRKVRLKQMKDENILLSFNHSSMNDDIETDLNKKISIYDCLDLFTQKEEIENIYCENCKKHQIFNKILKIERVPQYLVITLKRFKYTLMYRAKINCPIKFPINNINLKPYLVGIDNPDKGKIYDLFGIVNHIGSLSGGHYYSIIEQNNKWIKYNDSNVSDFTRTFDTQEAYILIYKLKENDNNLNCKFRFNFWGLMNTAYKIYVKRQLSFLFNYVINERGEIVDEHKDNCYFYYGEPVKYNDKYGYIINAAKKEDSHIYLKIKFRNGIEVVKFDSNNINKETVKDNNLIKDHKNFNFMHEKVGCTEDCILF